jgi:hypothetical protein
VNADQFRARIQADWQESLHRIHDRAKALGAKAVLAFDLDSTLFDNRPRQARIVREFGQARNIEALLSCAASHFDCGWDMKAAFLNCGLSAADADAVFPDAKQFWVERFFTSPYCLDDEPIEGAADFVNAIARTGAQIVYLTGRHEGMREGTVGSLRQSGFPVPGGNVKLLMKPTFEESDDAFKREAHAALPKMGTVLAAFDNEPTHANDYRTKFPDATIIHLATDHSGRPVEILDGVISVPHFGVKLPKA